MPTFTEIQIEKHLLMNEQDDMFPYDENDAIKFIRNYIPQEIKDKYSDDDIVYLTDIVYDYYDKKGLFAEGQDEELELDEEDIIGYVAKTVKKDKEVHFDEEDIRFLVLGELEYEDSLGVFGD